MLLVKLPMPEDTQSQRQYEDVEEEKGEEEGYVRTVDYNDQVYINKVQSVQTTYLKPTLMVLSISDSTCKAP